MSVKKRFIAGATCPECGKIDTVYIIKGSAQQSRHCVDCGFGENKDFGDEGSDPTPDPVSEWEPVRLSVDPRPKS